MKAKLHTVDLQQSFSSSLENIWFLVSVLSLLLLPRADGNVKVA